MASVASLSSLPEVTSMNWPIQSRNSLSLILWSPVDLIKMIVDQMKGDKVPCISISIGDGLGLGLGCISLGSIQFNSVWFGLVWLSKLTQLQQQPANTLTTTLEQTDGRFKHQQHPNHNMYQNQLIRFQPETIQDRVI